MLKGRLLLVYNKIPSVKDLCDVGTDHGYIPIQAILQGKAEQAFALDMNEGPLKSARRNAVRFGVVDKMHFRQGDGLFPLEGEAVECIVIAGMGGELIRRIVSDNLEQAKKASFLVFQPMNSSEALRGYLFEQGFDIYDEELAREGNKLYQVICAKFTGAPRTEEEFMLLFGEKLFEKKDPLLPMLLDKAIIATQKALGEMKKAQSLLWEEEQNKERILERLLFEKEKLENWTRSRKAGGLEDESR